MADATAFGYRLDPSITALVNADEFISTEPLAFLRVARAYRELESVFDKDQNAYPDICWFIIYTYAKMRNADNEKLAFVLPAMREAGQLMHMDIAFAHALLVPLDGIYEVTDTVIDVYPHRFEEYGETSRKLNS